MISDILNIITSGKHPYTDSDIYHNIVRVNNGCHNYQLVGISCDNRQIGNVFAEIVWNPVEYIDEIERQVNALGREWKLYHRKRARLSFNGVVDEITLNELQEIALQPSAQLIPWSFGTPFPGWDLVDMQIEVQDAIDALRVTVSFAVENADSVITGCCGTPFDNADYEPCPRPSDPSCGTFDVAIAVAGMLPSATLSATVSDVPDGDTVTYTWYQVFPNGSTVNLGDGATLLISEPGTYRVQATSMPTNCIVIDSLVVAGNCENLNVDLQQVNGVLIATPNQPQLGGQYTWKFQAYICAGDTDPGEVVLPENTSIITPNAPGLYTVEYDANPGVGDCQASAQLPIGGCGFYDPQITRAGDVLTVDVSFFCTAPTIQWQRDDDNSGTFVNIDGETSESLTVDGSGIYRAVLNGQVPGDFVCDFNPTYCVTGFCQASVYIQPTSAQLMAMPLDCDNPVYSWEQQLQPGPWEPYDAPNQDPTAPVITPVFPGNYRVTVNCDGGCTASAEITFFPNNDIATPLYSQLFVASDPAGEVQFTVTNFKLADLGNEDEINWRYQVYRNGVRVTWMDIIEQNTLGNHTNWSFDEPNNIIQVPVNDPLYPGDWLLIVDTKRT